MLYTFMLCIVVLNAAASKFHAGNNQVFGITIGLVIVAGAYSGGSASMGCSSHVVAFGIDVACAYFCVYYCYVYTVFELVGATLAAGAFMVCRAKQEALDSPEQARCDEGNEDIQAWLLSEFLGTYVLVLSVGLNVLSGSAAAAFSIAASLMCMIFALRTFSGAHFNPWRVRGWRRCKFTWVCRF